MTIIYAKKETNIKTTKDSKTTLQDKKILNANS